MSDTTTVWDPVNARGDWVLETPSVEQALVQTTTPQQFGLGDGSSLNFWLTPVGQIISGLVAQIYRTDWQGQQLLYPTPRTNGLVSTQTFGNSPWVNSGATVADNATVAPDGTTTAAHIADASAASGSKNVSQSGLSTISANAESTSSIFAQAAEYNFLLMRSIAVGVGGGDYYYALFDLVNGDVSAFSNVGAAAGASAQIGALPNGWFRCAVSGIASTSPSAVNVQTLVAAQPTNSNANVRTGTPGSGCYVWGAQLEAGSSTSYIAAGATPATITDYVLAANGVVTLSLPPALNAALSWSGQYFVNDFTPGGFLQTGSDLETVYLISMFTDRSAQSGDVIPDGTNDRRGWIGDAGAQYPIGSRLWLLSRAAKSQQTMNRARAYVTEAVQWLLDDGVVAKHDIMLAWIQSAPGTWGIGIWIQAYRPDGTRYPQFNWVWGEFQ
jgi:phage gp46-like protein